MSEVSGSKKVLIIGYYWPPSGGIGIFRNLKFVKYLREFGWEPIMLTALNPSYPFIDNSQLEEIPDGITVLKSKIWEPLDLFKKFSGRKKTDSLQSITAITSNQKSWIDELGIWIRGNFFVPDARVGWVRPSVKFLSQYLKEHHIDVIMASGPPHSALLIGMEVAKKFNIPFLADFQDPWTQVDYYKQMKIGKWADRKHRRLEQAVFNTANKITIVSPSWKRDLESIGAQNVSVLYLGFDEADFLDFRKQSSGYFKIFHAGLLGKDRNLSSFFGVIRRILDKYPEYKDILRLEFAGEVDYSNKMLVNDFQLNEITTFYGLISRKEVLKHYEESNLLLLPINQAENEQGRIPGKLFECMRTYTPMLVFGPNNSDVKNIVESKGLGASVQYEGEENVMENYILSHIQQFLEKSDMKEDKRINIDEFSNFQITKQLAFYLDELNQ
ncbi:MAG: glycosyltransferase [Chitinophagales bacterium]|nr:glycosyltransferase [Chitinophagales bacterium]MCZ2392565.1 glycosyltransferase [Chitinophagales bacterium]